MSTPEYVLVARGKAQEIRDQLSLGIDAIGDIFHFIEDQGILLVRRPMGRDGVDGIYAKRKGIQLMLVNSDKSLGRQRFTAAHEYAHGLFDDINLQIDENIFETESLSEKRANAFAVHFLVPEAGVNMLMNKLTSSGDVKREPSPYDVVHVQKHYGISYLAALYHLRNIRIINEQTRRAWEKLSPMKMAFELGYYDLYSDAERGIKTVPNDYFQRAIKAYEQSDISLYKLAELLEEPKEELESQLTELQVFPEEVDLFKE